MKLKADRTEMVYDDEVAFDRFETHVCCWLRAPDGSLRPTLVKASRKYVLDNWGAEWSNREAVKAAFKAHRLEHLAAAQQRLPETGGAGAVYLIG